MEKVYSIWYKILYPFGTEQPLTAEVSAPLTCRAPNQGKLLLPLSWSPSSLHLVHTLEKRFLVSYAKISVLQQKRLSGISEALHELSLIPHGAGLQAIGLVKYPTSWEITHKGEVPIPCNIGTHLRYL